MEDKSIKEINNKLGKLSEEMAVMSNDICNQSKVIDKMSNSFEKLTIFIEKTNENDKKISHLFKRLDNIYENGTKNCPLNASKLSVLEKHIGKLDNYLIGVLIAIAMQIIGIIIYFIEKHLV